MNNFLGVTVVFRLWFCFHIFREIHWNNHWGIEMVSEISSRWCGGLSHCFVCFMFKIVCADKYFLKNRVTPLVFFWALSFSLNIMLLRLRQVASSSSSFHFCVVFSLMNFLIWLTVNIWVVFRVLLSQSVLLRTLLHVSPGMRAHVFL